MRVLISGGGGFLGQWLQAKLSGGEHEVWAPCSADLDVRDLSECRRWIELAAPDWVFHLAAKTQRNEIAARPDLCMNVAVEGTRHLLQAVGESGGASRVVVASSCHVYGAPLATPISEEHPLQPESTYGLSKKAMEEAVLEAGNVDVVIARLFHLVGPGQPNAFAVASWAQQSREFPGPVTVGSLDLERDYLDVRDGAAALVTLAQRGATKQAYNVCRGEGVSLRWMFEQVTGGREAQVDPERQRTDDPPSIVGDPRKLKALTWTPEVSLVDSLAEMSQYLDA